MSDAKRIAQNEDEIIRYRLTHPRRTTQEDRIKALAKTAAIQCVGMFSTTTIEAMSKEHWTPDAKFEEIIAATICDAQAEIERLRLGIQTVNMYLGNLPSAAALCLKTTLEAALDGAAFADLETLKSECVEQDGSDTDRFIERVKQNLAKREAEMRENDPERYKHYLAGLEKMLQAFQAEKSDA